MCVCAQHVTYLSMNPYESVYIPINSSKSTFWKSLWNFWDPFGNTLLLDGYSRRPCLQCTCLRTSHPRSDLQWPSKCHSPTHLLVDFNSWVPNRNYRNYRWNWVLKKPIVYLWVLNGILDFSSLKNTNTSKLVHLVRHLAAQKRQCNHSQIAEGIAGNLPSGPESGSWDSKPRGPGDRGMIWNVVTLLPGPIERKETHRNTRNSWSKPSRLVLIHCF